MIKIVTKELKFDKELKKKIEFVCDFCNTNPTFINGNIRNIDRIDASETIDELEDKVSKLQEALSYFRKLWRKFIEFLQNKFFPTDKYDEIITELYHENIIDDNGLDEIQNNYKYTEKDDFER